MPLAVLLGLRPGNRVYKARNRKGPTGVGASEKCGSVGGGDGNVERLLTKIEVVVVTGIAPDDALREGRSRRRSQLLEKDPGYEGLRVQRAGRSAARRDRKDIRGRGMRGMVERLRLGATRRGGGRKIGETRKDETDN